MKKQKIWTLAMAAALIAAMAGCGKAKEDGTETAGNVENADEYVYVAEYFSLNEDGMNVSSVVLDTTGTVFFTGTKDDRTGLFSVKSGEENITELPVELEEDEHIGGIGNDLDGNIIVAVTAYNSEAEEKELTKAELRTIAADGTVVKSVDTGNTFKNVSEFYIQDILADKDGRYYVCSGRAVYVLSQDGQMYCDISPDTYISDMFSMNDERIVIGYLGNNGWALEEIDVQQKRLKTLESPVYFDYGNYQGGTASDLVYTQDAKLYTCNLKDEKPTEVLSWIDCNIDSNNLQDVVILEDESIVAVTIDWSTEEAASELAVLTKKNRSEVPEKKVLTYGTLYLPYFASKDIVAFNKQSDEYRIEVKEYGDDNTDYETKVSLFTADISSGKGPDIIDLYYSPVDLEELVSMGVLEDLTPYLESDKELKREDFIENVLQTYELDGKLYGIMPYFGVRTLIGKVSDVGEEASWTVDDVIELADSKDKDIELIPYTTKASALHMMISINKNLFVDSETGECNFTGEDFIKILEFANRFPKEMEYDPNAPSEIEKIRSGKQLLSESTITSVQLYQMHEYMFGEEVNYIGYPTLGQSGSVIEANGTTAGMSATSENKDGVWEFLRFDLTQKRQENSQSANGGFPIMKSALEKQFEKDMKVEYYEDADGNQKEKAKSTWGNADYSVDVFAASKEQVDKIRQLINTAGNDKQSDSKMFQIINEEAVAYFEGQKSPEDVAALIQNRVQIYVNETR